MLMQTIAKTSHMSKTAFYTIHTKLCDLRTNCKKTLTFSYWMKIKINLGNSSKKACILKNCPIKNTVVNEILHEAYV